MPKYHQRDVANTQCDGTGRMLRELMRSKKMSKKRLARESGVSEATLRRMCGGNLVGSIHSWASVLDILDGDCNEFFRVGVEIETENPNRNPKGETEIETENRNRKPKSKSETGF